MKKLITLLLVLTGMVCSASAKTFYVQNNCSGWDQLCLWAWGGTTPTSSSHEWPGVNLLTTTTPVVFDGKTYYPVNIGDNTDFILSNGKDSSTKQNERATWKADEIVENAYYQFDYGGEGTDNGYNIKWYHLTKYGTYNFTVTTATSWTNFYAYYFNTHTNTDIVEWKAIKVEGTDNVYTFSAFIPTALGVIFHDGNGNQTCDMFPSEGTTCYYIASIINSKQNDSWGEIATTNSSGYATFVNDKPLTIPTGIAYGAEDDGDGTATAHAINNPQAKTPMLIKGNASTTYHFAASTSGTGLDYTNAFKAGPQTGLASNPSANVYNYILNGDTFKAANGKNVNPDKAYLQLSAQAPVGARILVFDDEESTGINASLIDNEKKTNDNLIYNLAGQRVVLPTKGLYIVNGKKVIIK